MKKRMGIIVGVFIIVTLIIWLLQKQSEQPGNSARLRNDPTYSTRNYKQSNKADAAREWAADSGISVLPATNTPLPNDKQPVPGVPPAGSITTDAQPPANDRERNYKPQRVGRRPPPPADTATR